MLKKSCFMIILLLLAINGCKGKQGEIHIVPHHFNLKAYSYETPVNLTFVTTYEINSIENVLLTFSEKSIGTFDGLDIKEYYELKVYKGYNVFILNLILKNIEGDIHIKSIKYDLNKTSYSFETDIRIQSEFERDVHFPAGNNSSAVIFPAFAIYGFEQVLKSTADVTITNIFFEGTGNFDLNQYISSISINDKVFGDKFFINENDAFYLEILPKDALPKDLMLIDQIIIEYNDNEQKTGFGYVLVPLFLYSTELCSEAYIDYILEGEG